MALWQSAAQNCPMASDERKRQAKATALSSLQLLRSEYSDESEIATSISRMIASINEFVDVKPDLKPEIKPDVKSEDAVKREHRGSSSDAVKQEHRGPSSDAVKREHHDSSSASESKRPRRKPDRPADQRTVDDFPINRTSVLLPRVNDDGQRYNQYCLVVGHTDSGQLRIQLPDPHAEEDTIVVRSICSLRSNLGSEEVRPLIIASASSSKAAHPTEAAPPPPPTERTSPPIEPPTPPPIEPPVDDDRSADDQLAASALRRSGGRTRDQLNPHLSALGLAAMFGQQVVSMRHGVVSHLTFVIGDWNVLPPSANVPFVWWLGTGPKRLPTANLINPAHHTQPQGGVPVFFAIKRSSGGALCYYGGHYETRSFVVLSEEQLVKFKDRERQARIELHFSHFDEALAAAVDAIPAEL